MLARVTALPLVRLHPVTPSPATQGAVRLLSSCRTQASWRFEGGHEVPPRYSREWQRRDVSTRLAEPHFPEFPAPWSPWSPWERQPRASRGRGDTRSSGLSLVAWPVSGRGTGRDCALSPRHPARRRDPVLGGRPRFRGHHTAEATGAQRLRAPPRFAPHLMAACAPRCLLRAPGAPGGLHEEPPHPCAVKWGLGPGPEFSGVWHLRRGSDRL